MIARDELAARRRLDTRMRQVRAFRLKVVRVDRRKRESMAATVNEQ